MSLYSIKLRIRVSEPHRLSEIVENLSKELTIMVKRVIKISSTSLLALSSTYMIKIRIESVSVDQAIRFGIPNLVLIIEIDTQRPEDISEVIEKVINVVREFGGLIELM